MAEADFYVKKGLTVAGNASISGDIFLKSPNIPQNANDPGTKGQIIYDNDYIYVCVENDTWKRSKLSSW